jgi:dCTP deaminase
MILSGTKIQKEIKNGHIIFRPMEPGMINPNSCNYHLGHTIKKFKFLDGDKHVFEEIKLPKEGYVLGEGQMYLANTKEIIGSDKYAMSLLGRSSIGRLGLFVQTSADLGHTTSCHQWTLELVASKKIRIYPGMSIGQVSFWCNKGIIKKYHGVHANHSNPQESLI